MRSYFFISSFIIALIFSENSFSQQWTWAVNGGGDNQASNADRAIATSNNGTVYIAGYFTKTLTLGNFTLTNPDDYYSDMYLAKMDSAGNVIWAKSWDLLSSYNEALGICLDNFDNIYLTGAYDGKIFASKYDSSGALIWNSSLQDSNIYGYGTAIAIDQDDNVFIAGKTDGSSILIKLDYEGKLQWKSYIKGCNSNGCWANDLAVDRLGYSYIAGGFDCDSLLVGDTILYRLGTWGNSTFLIKYSPEGKIIWLNNPRGHTNATPQVALSDAGYVFLTGSNNNGENLIFSDSVILSAPITNLFPYIAKYDLDGNLKWARNAKVYEGFPKDIAADLDNNLYLGASVWESNTKTSRLVKYDQHGDTLYSTRVDAGYEDIFGLSNDNFSNTYIIGHSNAKGMGVSGPANLNPYTAAIAKFNTGSATKRRTAKPRITRMFTLCPGNHNVPLLTAVGENVKWYKDRYLTLLVNTGATYQPSISTTDTFYVTQTINGIESWPQQVIIYFSNIGAFKIQNNNDTLSAVINQNFTYQWYLDSTALPYPEGRKPIIYANQVGWYKVVVSDMGCLQQASHFFYADKCLGSTINFISSIKGYFYRWQVSTDGGINYNYIANSTTYSGINSDTLVIHNNQASFRTNKYRCEVNFSQYSPIHQIVLQTKWTGLVDNLWRNPGNWSCGRVPDILTDVLVDTGRNLIIDANAEAHSIRNMNNSVITINPGIQLTVGH